MGDIVTQLQNQVNDMCSLFFNFAGALQRDAPKASVGGEAINQDSNFNLKEQAQTMAKQLIVASRSVDQIIDGLPDLNQSTESREKKVSELWAEQKEVEREVQSELETLEMIMAELQEIHGVIVEDQMEDQSDGEKESDGSEGDSQSDVESVQITTASQQTL